MTCIQPNKSTIICLSDKIQEIELDGKSILFEFHSYFGPVPLNRRTEDPWKQSSYSRISEAMWDKANERWKEIYGK